MSKEKSFDEQMKVALEQNYPTFEIPDFVRDQMYHALAYASPILLGISGTEMRELATNLLSGDKLNCYQYAVASNNLEMRTPKELSIDRASYFDLMVEVEKLATQFNQDTLDIRNAVIADMAKKNIRKV